MANNEPTVMSKLPKGIRYPLIGIFPFAVVTVIAAAVYGYFILLPAKYSISILAAVLIYILFYQVGKYLESNP